MNIRFTSLGLFSQPTAADKQTHQIQYLPVRNGNLPTMSQNFWQKNWNFSPVDCGKRDNVWTCRADRQNLCVLQLDAKPQVHSQNPPVCLCLYKQPLFGSLVVMCERLNGNQLHSCDASCGVSALPIELSSPFQLVLTDTISLHPSQGHPQNKLLMRFRNVVVGHSGYKFKGNWMPLTTMQPSDHPLQWSRGSTRRNERGYWWRYDVGLTPNPAVCTNTGTWSGI